MIPRVIVGLIIAVAILATLVLSKTQFANESITAKADQPARITATNIKIDYPKPKASYTEPTPVTARSAVVVDEKTGISLYEKEPELKHLPASVTKLMTALIALETCPLDLVITIDRVEKAGTQMGLEIGDKITVENLLYGLLIASGNDAAFVLAQNCPAGNSDFVARMNQKAKDLGMDNTNFLNPAGFDNDLQYSTAKDLAELARIATANPQIAKIVKTRSTVVTDTTGLRTYYLENVNKLLGVVDGLNGVKTGQTDGALEIVITRTNRNGNGIIVSVLGSKDRFGESQALIEWAFSNYDWPK